MRRLATASSPIGVFDSGVGGLSVLAELRRYLPHEDVLYFADHANNPYGERSPDDIERLTLQAVRWLQDQGCKLVVIACNTACAFSLRSVRAQVTLPIVGLVPALKPAVAGTRSGVVSVFATPVTLEGSLLQEVIAQHATPAGVQVLKVWHRELVPLVEAGQATSPRTRALLRELLTPHAQAGADALVLGCTHYPFLDGAIRAEFGDTFALYDSGAGVAKRTRALLEAGQVLNPAGVPGRVRLQTTGDLAVVGAVVQQLLPDLGQVLDLTPLNDQQVNNDQADADQAGPPPVRTEVSR